MNVNFGKDPQGLVPTIVQHADTGEVLMLAYMNEEAYTRTVNEGRVTFFSRSRQRLWTKGEMSGNSLDVRSISIDCDGDTILIKAIPAGPVCHTGQSTCFGESGLPAAATISLLEATIEQREVDRPEGSYVSALFDSGLNRIAQKVGEEAVELVIAAKDDDPQRFISEAADLLFHYLVLLRAKGVAYSDVLEELQKRSQPRR